MITVDTNLLVRVITADDEQQAALAAEVLRSNQVFLCKTVILELEWVLRYSYEYDVRSVTRALTTLVRLENAVVEDEAVVLQALRWYEQEMDFADALHLASGGRTSSFVTFDRGLMEAGERIQDTPEIQLLAGVKRD